MKAKMAPALRAFWAVTGMTAGILVVLASAADGLIFALSYGSPLGSYAGQAGDRRTAVHLAIMLAALWIFIPLAMLWPALRWRRRGLL